MRKFFHPFLFLVGFISLEAAPFAYVTNSQDSTVSVIDAETNTVVETVDVVYSPSFVAITPNGESAFVLHDLAGLATVVDTTYNNVVDI